MNYNLIIQMIDNFLILYCISLLEKFNFNLLKSFTEGWMGQDDNTFMCHTFL